MEVPSLHIKVEWISRDLLNYRGVFDIKVISVHRQVINLFVEGWPHLLLLAGPNLYKGPATLSFNEDNFNYMTEVIGQVKRVCFAGEEVIFDGIGIELTLGWVGVPVPSFGLPPLLTSLPNQVKANLARSRCALMKEEEPFYSAASALLGLKGGELYFRENFLTYFPQFIAALIEKSKVKMINYSKNIIGMGRGSTPTGDDLICGAMLVAHYYARWSGQHNMSWLELPVKKGTATTALSIHSIELSARGLAVAPVRNYLIAIFTENWKKDSLFSLLAMGSSTGFDLAVSIQVTLEYYFDIESSRSPRLSYG